MDYGECRMGARHRPPHRHFGRRETRGYRGLDPPPVQRLCAPGTRLRRGRIGVRPPESKGFVERLFGGAAMRTLLLFIGLVLVASPAAAQVLIKNAQIYDESGQLITTNILTGADGKIATIDTVILAPPGVKTIDCGECIVTPGLVEV